MCAIYGYQVRLVGVDKEKIGVLPTREAMSMAEDVGLDLVMISPDSDPPVCRIMDLSKYKYELERKKREQKKMANATRVRT